MYISDMLNTWHVTPPQGSCPQVENHWLKELQQFHIQQRPTLARIQCKCLWLDSVALSFMPAPRSHQYLCPEWPWPFPDIPPFPKIHLFNSKQGFGKYMPISTSGYYQKVDLITSWAKLEDLTKALRGLMPSCAVAEMDGQDSKPAGQCMSHSSITLEWYCRASYAGSSVSQAPLPSTYM